MIVQAACRVSIPNVEEYQIIPLHRHGDMECKILEFGFLDNHGNFYNRKSAAKWMRDYGQKTRLGDLPCEELYSEDLY